MKALNCWLCYGKTDTLYTVREDTGPICSECKEWILEDSWGLYKTKQTTKGN